MGEQMPDTKLDREAHDIATMFMLQGIQSWGQSMEDRREAKVNYLRFAGFDDPDSEAATEFLRKLDDTMPWGKFENEVAHLKSAMLAERNKGNE